MRLAYMRQGNRSFVALARGEGWLNLGQAMRDFPAQFPWLTYNPEVTLIHWLRNTPNLLPALDESVSHLETSGGLAPYWVEGDYQLLAPLTAPSKIIALGRNYAAHAAEQGHSAPSEPILFAKAPSSIVGPGDEIVYPHYVRRLDPEIELGVVIGRRAKQVSEEQAMSYVAGYTIVNDVTARDIQKVAQDKGHPWFVSKSLDTFCPLGPYLVLQDQLPDPHNLELTLSVNGQVRQHANTGMMIFHIPQLIAFISQRMTLEPGDLIATGTPEGIAPLQRGDVVECSITGLGVLANRVV
jgi:5-oxopent-3-ene-1,2,5-tricarboxylate decarboxylase/2-hydroxyhepta-2,4-diene-1,7-dioate isomerase